MSQQFVLIPKENYIKQHPRSLDVLEHETVNEKAKVLTLLQRERPKKKPKDTKVASSNDPKASDRNNREASLEVIVDDETMAFREIETDTEKNLRRS